MDIGPVGICLGEKTQRKILWDKELTGGAHSFWNKELLNKELWNKELIGAHSGEKHKERYYGTKN